MNLLLKRIISVVLILIVFFHFLCISIYCLPFKNNSLKIQLICDLYVYPIFNQNWCLFVPPPTTQNRILVRFQTKNGYSNWVDILQNEIIAHKSKPLSGHEAIYLLFSNSLIHTLGPLLESEKKVYSEKPKNIEFNVLNFEVSRYLKLNYNLSNKTGFEIILVSSNKTYSNVYYFKSLQVI